ncbi:unnamed protein product [Pleuronectes platessa]|uniref:Uncharacterized protein n=1 Tax=Pleuronectes platessa TaxID=8262 RepID=A0A9N7VA84_PLEPL|nr:unnamed protein product [Pleuronectes platessa]
MHVSIPLKTPPEARRCHSRCKSLHVLLSVPHWVCTLFRSRGFSYPSVSPKAPAEEDTGTNSANGVNTFAREDGVRRSQLLLRKVFRLQTDPDLRSTPNYFLSEAFNSTRRANMKAAVCRSPRQGNTSSGITDVTEFEIKVAEPCHWSVPPPAYLGFPRHRQGEHGLLHPASKPNVSWAPFQPPPTTLKVASKFTRLDGRMQFRNEFLSTDQRVRQANTVPCRARLPDSHTPACSTVPRMLISGA